MAEPLDPVAEYGAHREGWRARQALWQRSFVRIGNWRLTIAIGAGALAWLAFGPGLLSGWWLLLPLIVFVALFVRHQGVIRRRTLAERAIRYYDRGLAKVQDRWAAGGETGEQFRDNAHVYSEDLDVFGKGSLFELASTCRTAGGEDVLASWLLETATRETALARQEAVRELRERLELREEIALLGEDVRSGVHAGMAARWGSQPPVRFPAPLRYLAPSLAASGMAALLAYFAALIPLWPFLILLGCDFLFLFTIRKQTAVVIGGVEMPAKDLGILALMIARLEREPFAAPLLKHLQSEFRVNGVAASGRIHHLQRWMEFLDSSDHVLIRVIGPVLLWREQAAMGIEAWRQTAGPHIGTWICALGEFEALSSLASLAFDHPSWSFPDLAADAPPTFEAADLRHPLIPAAKCVANDASLNADLRLLIVSGSNMSGKSTLLRTIGLNAVLAWAGAPVAAKHLRVSRLHIGASIRTTDSLQDNRSRFFAEITRIRQIVDLMRDDSAVLFLLDELLSGTNSHDRRIGASGVIRGLLRGRTIGLITTHDLALAQLEQDLGALAANVHFEDHMEQGRMEFDYRLQPGVVTHSNALELMRAVGLEI
ncbi:MAG TPA: hypothetical protein VGL97_09570 [Bryobacteraceae bacterium]